MNAPLPEMAQADQTAGQRVEPGTPLPWEAQSPEDEGVCIIGLRCDDGGWPYFSPTNGIVAYACMLPTEIDAADTAKAEANARFIVHACNLHHEILEELVEARRVISVMANCLSPEITDALVGEPLGAIDAAITKARGGAA